MPSDPLPYDSTRPRRVSVSAIISLILDILAIPLDYALCIGSVLGVAAMIIGFGAIRQINMSNGEVWGKPFAISGIIAGAISILLGIGCGIMVLNALGTH